MLSDSSGDAEDFGVIVACHRGDYPLALGCVASVRWFMGDVPIAVIADGDFRCDELLRAGVRVIRRKDVVDPFLRERSFGYGLTKMIAFWEAPWERFMYLDADSVLWGNPRQKVDFATADVIVDLPRHAYSKSEVAEYFFIPEELEARVRKFDWRGRTFFNSGFLCGRRGILDLKVYRRLLEIGDAQPGLFKCGEQGILNFMVFLAADELGLRLRQLPIQTLVPDHPIAELRGRFVLGRGGPKVSAGSEGLIHWCGSKPWMVGGSDFRSPMTFFRRRVHSLPGLWCGDALRAAGRSRLVRGASRRRARFMK